MNTPNGSPNASSFIPSYEKLLTILDQSQIVIFVLSAEDQWPVKYISDNVVQWGYSSDQFLSNPQLWESLVVSEDCDLTKKIIHESITRHKSQYIVSYRIKTASGEIRWVKDQTNLIYDEQGNLSRLEGVIVDINEEREKDRLIQSMETRFREIINSTQNVAIFYVTPKGEITYANHGFSKVTGYTMQEIYSFDAFTLLHPDEEARRVEIYNNLCQNQQILNEELRIRVKSGEYRMFEFNVSPLMDSCGHLRLAIGIALDVNAKHREIREIKDREQRYRRITEQSSVALFILRENSLEFFNDRLCELTGYSRNEISKMDGQQFVGLAHSDDEAWLRKKILEIFFTNGEFEEEVRMITKDQQVIWLKIHMKFTQGAYYGSISNITRLKEIEVSLKENIHLLETVFESMHEPLLWIEVPSGKILNCNKSAAEFFQISTDLLLVQNIAELHLRADKAKLHHYLFKTSEQETPTNSEFQIVLPSGEKRFVTLYKSSIEFDRQIVQVIYQDITELKRYEEERIRSERIQSISLLAGGIAHDFNNILMGILGNVNLLQLDDNVSPEMRELLANIENATQSAHGLTKQLLTFSKGGDPIRKIENLAHLVKQVVSFVMHGSNCTVQNFLPDVLPTVKIDFHQIFQVFQNLLLNAIQSMKTGGVISIQHEEITVHSEHTINLSPGKYIEISITDQGHGIPEEAFNKIFTPYYSTKIGGTGLGLATAYSIMKRHNGAISFTSEEGKGTTFYLYLPITEQEPQQEPKVPQTNSFSNSGRVLVMDDDPIIQQTVPKILEKLGYDVDTAADGQETIQKYQQSMEVGKKYDVVLMDLTIPGGMGGKDTIKLLRNIDPTIFAVVSSGYSNDPVMAKYQDYGFNAILKKPYTIEELKHLMHHLPKIPT